jgi:uncharacterized protein (DUF58 family)
MDNDVFIGIFLLVGLSLIGLYLFWKHSLKKNTEIIDNPESKQDTAELIRKVRKVEIKTKGISTEMFAGEYHTAFKGRGMSFSEVRSYQYGDDIRNIDWNVTARAREPFVKVFEEERELTVMLMIDVSGSSFFGTGEQSRSELITELAAVLAFSAANNNDKVGVLFFSDIPEKFIPPKKGREHILRIIRELLEYKPRHTKTDLKQALRYMNNIIKKRCICFVISDFIGSNYEDAVKIVARRHDLIGIRMEDALETTMPNMGILNVTNMETGKHFWVDTADKNMQKTYAEKQAFYAHYFQNSFSKAGANTILIRNDYTKELLKFFKRRG